MPKADEIRNSLITKLMAISNQDFLKALDQLISTQVREEDTVELTKEQRIMLEMSDKDIAEGNTISHEEVDRKIKEWLKA